MASDAVLTAAQQRRAAMTDADAGHARTTPPNGGELARAVGFAAEMRAQLVERDGRKFYRTEGYASVTGKPYDMWDAYGAYQERIEPGAFRRTLAAGPDVAYLVNHRGVTMARTTNGTLELVEDSTGLHTRAWLNPDRQDVRDLVSAIGDGLITEMSFAFMLSESDAEWSEDFTTFSIRGLDIDRGDVSAVNYGANPHTSIAARAREVLRDLDHLPAGARRAALARLTTTDGGQIGPAVEREQPPGRSLTSIESWLWAAAKTGS